MIFLHFIALFHIASSSLFIKILYFTTEILFELELCLKDEFNGLMYAVELVPICNYSM
jgi:hypothetical protein